MLKPYLMDVVEEANRNRTDKTALGRLYERLAGYDILEEEPDLSAEQIRRAVFEWCEESIEEDDDLSEEQERAAQATLKALQGTQGA